MAHSKTFFTKGCAMQKCVLFEILHLFMSLWDSAPVEARGMGRSHSLGRRSPPAQNMITDFIYFKTVSFTTSDVY